MQLFLVYLFLKVSTCFGWFLHSSSGAHKCTLSFRYCQTILLQASVVYSHVILMMGGGTA